MPLYELWKQSPDCRTHWRMRDIAAAIAFLDHHPDQNALLFKEFDEIGGWVLDAIEAEPALTEPRITHQSVLLFKTDAWVFYVFAFNEGMAVSGSQFIFEMDCQLEFAADKVIFSLSQEDADIFTLST